MFHKIMQLSAFITTDNVECECSAVLAYSQCRQRKGTEHRTRYSERYITRCSHAQPKLIVPGLESKQLTLIEAVQSLGEYINDDDATIRARVIDYLSQVIGQLSPAFLSRQQLQVLCQFFCDRIEDGGAVGGLRKLQALGRFNKDMVAMTFRA